MLPAPAIWSISRTSSNGRAVRNWRLALATSNSSAQRTSSSRSTSWTPPALGSTFESHEEAAERFLLAEGKAEKDSLYYGGITDCVAYVLPPVTRQNDSEVLGQFASGSRLPQSTPFNSVGLLHKWETIQHPTPWTEAEAQAGRAFQALKQYVCDVFPVSGPIGRACRVCPPRFWDDVVQFARDTSSDAFELLTVERSVVHSRRVGLLDLTRETCRDQGDLGLALALLQGGAPARRVEAVRIGGQITGRGPRNLRD